MWTVVAAWRVVVKRAAADRLMLTAAAITIVLATTLLAAGPIYSDAVTLSALRRTLEAVPTDEANIEISVLVKPDGASSIDDVARNEISRTFSSVDHEIYESAVSDSYGLPQQTEGDAVDIAVFQYLDGIEDHSTLKEGRWPERSDGAHQTVISDRLAANRRLSVGDEILVANRRTPTEERSIVIVGVYTVTDASDPFWFNDQLALQSATYTPSFNTFGPFVVDRETLLADLTVVNTRLRWRVFINHDSITRSDLPTLIGNLRGLEDRLNAAAGAFVTTGVGDYGDFTVDTLLGPILSDAERSLTVTRSGVLMLSIQLSILAGVALRFIAGLLVESRRTETALLRSRGATNRQVLGVSLVEGAALTIPAALAGPWLAVAALSLLNHVGPLASIGLELHPSQTGAAYLLSFLAAVGCTAALAIPAYRSARSFSESYASQGRQTARSEAQKAGLDLALLALAVLLFWQLDVHGETLTASIRGRFGVDPLLIAAPAVGLVAGAVLALRVIPLIARAAEAIAGAARATVPALSAWQLSRRPLRYSRSALLLIMAISIGLFAATYTATWTRSQEDQAAFDVGADVRVHLNRRSSQAIADLHLRQAFLEIDSLQAAMPLLRKSGGGSTTGPIRRFVILDAASAGEVTLIRDDLGPAFSEAMQILVDGRPTLAAIGLPGNPMRIAATFGVEVVPLPEDLEVPADASVCFCPSATLVVQDADGLLHRIGLGAVEVDSGLQRMEADLVLSLDDGTELIPRYPLSLVDVEIRSPSPLDLGREATVAFGGVFVSEEAQGDAWKVATEDLDRRSWDLTNTTVAGAFRQPSIVPGNPEGDAMTFRITTGQAFGQFPLPAFFSIRPAGTVIEDPFPVVTTDRLLGETELAVGDDIRLRSLRISHDSAEIVATVTDFPTVDPAFGEAVLIDLPTFQMVSYEAGRPISDADEFWISTGGEPTDRVSAAVGASPFDPMSVIDGTEVADANKTDPIALGTMGSLTLGFVAAAVFAAVGFAVSATVSARDRITEFALLRALGLSNRQLGSWLALEQGALVVSSVALGTLIGLLLSWVALPLVSVTQAGTAPIPDVTLIYPWTTMWLLVLAVVASLAVIVSLLVGRLRRMGVGSLLRLGVD